MAAVQQACLYVHSLERPHPPSPAASSPLLIPIYFELHSENTLCATSLQPPLTTTSPLPNSLAYAPRGTSTKATLLRPALLARRKSNRPSVREARGSSSLCLPC